MELIITTNEERCASTAINYTGGENARVLISIDRGGNDTAALYQYLLNTDWHCKCTDTLKPHGVMPVSGSYSDIVDLEHLGICGINMPAGYILQHTAQCAIFRDDIPVFLSLAESTIKKLLALDPCKYTPVPYKYDKLNNSIDYSDFCAVCGKVIYAAYPMAVDGEVVCSAKCGRSIAGEMDYSG